MNIEDSKMAPSISKRENMISSKYTEKDKTKPSSLSHTGEKMSRWYGLEKKTFHEIKATECANQYTSKHIKFTNNPRFNLLDNNDSTYRRL